MKLTPWFLNFDFGGRARRSHYWANLGAWLLVAAVFLAVAAAVAPDAPATLAPAADAVAPAPSPAPAAEEPAADGGGGGLIGFALFIALLLAAVDGFAMVFRRAHDTGKSGWVMLLLFIPLVNLLPLYWLMIEDSQEGPNKYGAAVKAFYQPPAPAVP
jgi:uncharacterized membrane protein YhaH (DUF805 family)